MRRGKDWRVFVLLLITALGIGGCISGNPAVHAADSTVYVAAGNEAEKAAGGDAGKAAGNEAEKAAGGDTGRAVGSEAEKAAGGNAGRAVGSEAGKATGNEAGRASGGDTDTEVDYDAIQKETKDKLFSEFDFGEIDDSLKKLFPEKRMGFQELVTALISGKGEHAGKLILQFVKDRFSYEFRYNKQNLAYMLLIAIIAAVFTNFSNAFQNRQVSEISFYVLYMLLITMCLNAFRIAMSGIEGKLELLLDFMRVLCPSYFLAVAIASGSSSSLVFYNIVLFLIYVAEVLILKFLLPIVNIYIMVQVMNHLSGEEYLSQMGELLKKLISWILRTLITCVIGINVIQGMLAPAIDALKRSALTKTAAAIPGIGNAIGGVADVVLGAAVLIKNGIGMAGAVILIAICAVPILQMLIMTLMYKLAAALVQPVSDKRIIGCISSVSEGYELLVKVIFSTGVLFLLTIAIVTVSTS